MGEVEEFLKGYTTTTGGVIELSRHHLNPGRSNLMLKYPAKNPETKASMGFVGSHLDVVPADPAKWRSNPFVLSRTDEAGYMADGEQGTEVPVRELLFHSPCCHVGECRNMLNPVLDCLSLLSTSYAIIQSSAALRFRPHIVFCGHENIVPISRT